MNKNIDQDLSSTFKNWIEITLRKSIYNILKFSKERDLSLPQLGALIWIHRKGSCNISNFGMESGVSNAAASQLLDRMVQLGLINRSEDPDDRRVKYVNLTQNGIKILKESFYAGRKWIDNLVSSFSDEEKKDIIILLNRIIKIIKLTDD